MYTFVYLFFNATSLLYLTSLARVPSMKAKDPKHLGYLEKASRMFTIILQIKIHHRPLSFSLERTHKIYENAMPNHGKKDILKNIIDVLTCTNFTVHLTTI